MDVSGALVSLLAWPIQKAVEQEHTVAQVRQRAARRPVDVDTALDADLLRAAAWMLALLLTVPVAVAFSLVDGVLPGGARDAGWTALNGLVAACTLLTAVHGVRALIAGRTDDERWAARRRWIVPGNADVVVVVLVVLAGIGAAHL